MLMYVMKNTAKQDRHLGEQQLSSRWRPVYMWLGLMVTLFQKMEQKCKGLLSYFPTESFEPSENRLLSRAALNEGCLFRGSLEQLRLFQQQVVDLLPLLHPDMDGTFRVPGDLRGVLPGADKAAGNVFDCLIENNSSGVNRSFRCSRINRGKPISPSRPAIWRLTLGCSIRSFFAAVMVSQFTVSTKQRRDKKVMPCTSRGKYITHCGAFRVRYAFFPDVTCLIPLCRFARFRYSSGIYRCTRKDIHYRGPACC